MVLVRLVKYEQDKKMKVIVWLAKYVQNKKSKAMGRLLFGVVVLLLFAGCPVDDESNSSSNECPSYAVKKVHTLKVGDVIYLDDYGQPAQRVGFGSTEVVRIKGSERLGDDSYFYYFKQGYTNVIYKIHYDISVVSLERHCHKYKIQDDDDILPSDFSNTF